MRALALLALLSFPAASAAAQAIIVPAPCRGACLAAERPRNALRIDSVWVGANLARGEATTYVSHLIRNTTGESLDGAFFFPLPRGATIERAMVYENAHKLNSYNEWSPPAESRRLLEESVRGRREIRAYAGADVMHVRVPSIPPGGTRQVQIGYRLPLRASGGRVTYTYPLATMAAVAPVRVFTMNLSVRTPAGFVDLRSPSHAVDVQWGTETGRCPPEARCGFMSVPSTRIKEVRLEVPANARNRDFVLVYTPAAADGRDTTAIR